MDDKIKITVRFDPHLVSAMTLAARDHQAAVQRVLTPLVHSALDQVYARAEAESLGRKRTLVRRFQEALRRSVEGNHHETRRQLLMSMLTGSRVSNGFNFVEELNLAFHARLHVLCAANPDVSSFFTRASSRSKAGAAPSYRVSSECAPSTFVVDVYRAAVDNVHDDPFLFVRDVPADRYIERRKRCVVRINQLIEQVLFDRVNAMVYRLRREIMFPRRHGAAASNSSAAALRAATMPAASVSVASIHQPLSTRSESTNERQSARRSASRHSRRAHDGATVSSQASTKSNGTRPIDDDRVASNANAVEAPTTTAAVDVRGKVESRSTAGEATSSSSKHKTIHLSALAAKSVAKLAAETSSISGTASSIGADKSEIGGSATTPVPTPRGVLELSQEDCCKSNRTSNANASAARSREMRAPTHDLHAVSRGDSIPKAAPSTVRVIVESAPESIPSNDSGASVNGRGNDARAQTVAAVVDGGVSNASSNLALSPNVAGGANDAHNEKEVNAASSSTTSTSESTERADNAVALVSLST